MFGGILGIVWVSRQVWLSFTVRQPSGSEYMTRDETTKALAEHEVRMKSSLTDMKENLSLVNREVHDMKATIEGRLEKLETYAHESRHETANALNQLALKVERMIAVQELQGGRCPIPRQIDESQVHYQPHGKPNKSETK